MTNYQTGQEYNDLRWWIMPVAVMAGGTIVEVRARGVFSVSVTDPVRATEVEADPDSLPRYLQSLVSAAANDWIGERSASAASVAELTTITPRASSDLQARVETRLSELGIQVNRLTVEAVETV